MTGTEIILYDIEDDACIRVFDDDPNCYGVEIQIRRPYESETTTLTVDKRLLLGLANIIKARFNSQGFRAKGQHENDDSMLLLREEQPYEQS